jgi:hypothetical protein
VPDRAVSKFELPTRKTQAATRERICHYQDDGTHHATIPLARA